MEERFIKISSAAYKILEFFPESDPIKNKAKEKILAILENLPLVLGTDGWASLNKDKVCSQLLIDLDIFLSYLKIAKSQKWIDEMNYLILQKEYKSIEVEVKEKCKNLFIKEQKKFDVASPSYVNETHNEDEKVKIKENKLTERQEKIIEILNKNEKAQVSDIIRILPNITKRTIRRDLDGLLEMGKVMRVGEWNKIFYQTFKENNDGTIYLS